MSDFNNLEELLTIVRKFSASSASVDSTVQFLRDLVYPLFIQCRAEEVDSADGKSREISRVLLCLNKARCDYSSELVYQCNGVVIDPRTWTVVSLPPPAVNFRFVRKRLIENMGAADGSITYDIYPVSDGTTVTLYWFNNKWCFSTANGFEVNGYTRIGDKSYEQAFNDVAALYPDFSYDKLNKNYCYSIGFRHGDFHPLMTDPPSMWLISTYKTLSEPETTEEERVAAAAVADPVAIGIPFQASIDVTALVGDNRTPAAILAALEQKNNSALEAYLSSVYGNSKHRANPQKLITDIAEGTITPAIHYGYILRAPFSVGGRESNIVLESKLLTKVRQLIYNEPRDDHDLVSKLNSDNRMRYFSLRSYLSYRDRDTFIRLFPQFHAHYAEYKSVIEEIIAKLSKCNRNRSAFGRIQAGAKNQRVSQQVSHRANAVNKLVIVFENHISKSNERLNPYDNHTKSILQDFIVNPAYTYIYFNELYA